MLLLCVYSVKQKAKSSNSRHRTLLALLLVLFLVFVGAGLYVYRRKHVNHVAVTTTLEPSPKQQQDEIKENSVAKKQAVENPRAEQPSPAPQSSNIVLSTKQEANDTVTVLTQLKNVSNGQCKLIVTNGNKSTSQTADVIYQPEYSSCAGFSVPISELGKGTWSIQLTVSSNGTSVSQTINKEVI